MWPWSEIHHLKSQLAQEKAEHDTEIGMIESKLDKAIEGQHQAEQQLILIVASIQAEDDINDVRGQCEYNRKMLTLHAADADRRITALEYASIAAKEAKPVKRKPKAKRAK